MATRPNQKAKWRDSQKPGDFSGIRDRVNNFVDHSSDFKNRSTGIYTVGVLLGRSGIDRDTVQSLNLQPIVQALGTRPPKEAIIQRYKLEYPEYANIPDNRIIVMRSRPRVDFNQQGQLAQPLDTKTMQTMVREFAASLKQMKEQQAITVKNIVDLVRRSTYSPSASTANKLSSAERGHRESAKLKQTPLLSAILNTYISKPDSGSSMYPLQIIPNLSLLKQQFGTNVVNSVAIDFGEVIGPIALLTGNITGNALRLSREMLGAATQQLMQDAIIHFNAGAGDPLYDSFIEYNGKVIGLSSKGHVGGAAASAGTSMSSLGHAINEVKANSAALERLKPLLRDPKNKRMFDIISILSDESRYAMKWDKTLRILNLLDQNYSTSDLYKDIKHIKTLNNEDRANAKKLTNGLSQYIRDKISAAPRRRSEDKSAFMKFLRATNSEITQTLNNDPKFSEVCTWVLNHSSTIQIDLYTNKNTLEEAKRKSGPEYGGAMVVTNIVGTWPSTRVDTVQLLENVSDLRFMLGINGYAERYPDRATMPWVDTDFRDQVDPQTDDRTDSNLKTAKDWASRGINAPQTNVELPNIDNTPRADTIAAPQTNPRTQSTTRQSRASANMSTQTFDALQSFLVTHHIDPGETPSGAATAAGAYRFAMRIIAGNYDGTIAAIAIDFATLLNNPQISSLVQRETIDSIQHPENIMTTLVEAKYTPETAIQSVTLLYWTFVWKRYAEYSSTDSSVLQSQQFTKVVDTLEKYGASVIRDVGTRNKFVRTVKEKTLELAKNATQLQSQN